MKNKCRVILIHGNGGTLDSLWFPDLKKQLVKNKVDVVAVNFPDLPLARKKYWMPFLKEVLKADENSILVGHSTGAVAAMRFAESNKILGSILISAYHTDLGILNERKSGYFSSAWKWKQIRDNQKWIVQFSSIDDPFIPIKEARYVSKKLDTEYCEFTDEGHFIGKKKPKLKFPELLSLILTKVTQ